MPRAQPKGYPSLGSCRNSAAEIGAAGIGTHRT